MLYREILRLLAFYLFGFAAILLIPTLLAFYYQFYDPQHPQPHSTLHFIYTFLVTLTLGALCFYIGRSAKTRFYHREGIAAVVIIWLITPALSALPFLFSQTLTNPFQAYFEMVSGYTTTGATVLQGKKYDPETGQEVPIKKTIRGVIDTEYVYYGNVNPVIQNGKVVVEGVEAISKALLFWRSFTQWLGGLGVVVLFVAILPSLGIGGKLLYHTEVTGPVKEGISPRIQEAALQLWKIYLVLTFIQMGALFLTNPQLDFLDVSTITFSTLSTGGFSVKNMSIAAYGSFATELIVMIFMVLGSLNFTLYYYGFKGKFYKLYDPELFLYVVLISLASFFIVMNLQGAPRMDLNGQAAGYFSWKEAVRYGIFQTISAQTSTGFATTNYDIWPYFSQVILLVVMFLGGMSGSTSGGIKVVRLYMLFRIAQYKVESLFRPETIRSFRVAGKEVDTHAAGMVLIFFLLIIAISTLSTVLFVYDGADPETSLGMVACCINNVGFAFRMASPLDSFAFLSDGSLALASLVMILGRLEFFAVLAVFIPAFWKQS